MKHKDGVYIEVVAIQNGEKIHMKPSAEIETAMNIADSLSKTISGKEAVVTAIFDGKHMVGSKHYEGNAFDMRIYIYTDKQLKNLLSNLKNNLGPDYDIVHEPSHIHIEYDPK
jgi:hypothetical protein